MLKATHIYMTACKPLSCRCQYDMWDAQLYILENKVRPILSMLPGMVGAVKHSSGLVRVWPMAHMRRKTSTMMRGVPLLRQWMKATVMMVSLKNRTCRTMTATEVKMVMAATESKSYFWTQSWLVRIHLQRMWVTRWLLASGRRLSILTCAAVMRHVAVMATCSLCPTPLRSLQCQYQARPAHRGSYNPWWEGVLL